MKRYDTILAGKVRQRLAELPNIVEKEMMGGLVFMYNDKMCLGIVKDELMCRIDPKLHETCIEKRGCRTMDFTNRPMIGYVLIDVTGMSDFADFNFWIGLALDFNKDAKASKKKKSTKQIAK